MGFTLVELLAVIAILAVLAGVVVVAAGRALDRTEVVACRSERRVLTTALEASRAANHRSEYPSVAGSDGFDAVRVDGFLDWAQGASYWRYDTPAATSIGPTNLLRVNTSDVPSSECALA
jgi:prepilin-type N-terminal cleavage/methylation domain-containing protein